MSFDFFGQGIKEEDAGVKFSKEEDLFFEGKLPFLDPEGKKSIQLGQAVSLIKFSGLPPAMQRKIFSNLKLMSKGTLDYVDMKKILRGVALAQNRIEPSSININANIKTKLPVFYDESDDQEEEQPHQQAETKPQPQQQVTENKKPAPPPEPHRSPEQHELQIPVKSAAQVQVPPSRPPNAPAAHRHTHHHEEGMTGLQKYEEYWSTLPTEKGSKISGNQVKRLFGKPENKKELSKIWKLCNTTHKGYLSKGQLYVFVQLMKLKGDAVPNALTPQMKDIIKKIDTDGGRKKAEANLRQSQLGASQFDIDKSMGFDKSQHIPHQHQPQTHKHLGMSQFENFAEFNDKNLPPNSPKFPMAVTSITFNEPEIPKQIHRIPEQTFSKMHATSVRQMEVLANQIIPQLQSLSDDNERSTAALNEINSFMNKIEQNQMLVSNKLVEMKSRQDELNYRLNNTFMRMRNVLEKQFALIEDLAITFHEDIEGNDERVKILEGYASNIEGEFEQQSKPFQGRHNKNIYQPQYQQNQQMQHNEEAIDSQQPSSIYNKKSMESMKEMSVSMSVIRKGAKPSSGSNSNNPSGIEKPKEREQYESNESGTESSNAVVGGGIYPQKLFAQLRQHKYTGKDSDDQPESEEKIPSKPHPESEKAANFTFKKTQQRDIPADEIEEEDEAYPGYRHEDQHDNRQHATEHKSPPKEAPQAVPVKSQQVVQQVRQENKMTDQDAKRLYMKRVSTIQIVNCLAPIKEEEYAIVVQKIQSKTESQLDILYAGLYEKYQQKMQEEARLQKPPPQETVPTYDEFSSNNFKNVPPAHSNDFFN